VQVCRAEEAAAAAAVVVNYEEGGVLHTMAVPKRYRQPGGATTAEMPRVGIPAIMISREGGAVLRRAMREAPSAVAAELGRSVHFRAREAGRAPEPAAPASSPYAACTQPARFYWPGHPEGYLPAVGSAPPRAVQRAMATPCPGYPNTRYVRRWRSLGRDLSFGAEPGSTSTCAASVDLSRAADGGGGAATL
jgi:hypothetical protein